MRSLNKKQVSLILWVLSLLFVAIFSIYVPLNKTGLGYIKGLKINSSQATFEYGYKGIYKDERKLSKKHDKELYVQVESLANFYFITKEDPIFADENLGNEYKNSVLFAKSYHDEVLERLGNPVAGGVVPFEFDLSLNNVSNQYTKFLAEPSDVNAKALLVSYEKSLDLYKNSLLAYSKNLEGISEKYKNMDLNGIGATTSYRVLASDIDLMLKNADELEKEISSRRQILTGQKKYSRIKKTKTGNFSEKKEILGILPKEDLSIIQGAKNLEGPYVLKTGCFFEGGAKEHKFYSYTTNFKDREIFLTKLAENNFYLPSDIEGLGSPDYKKMGYDFIPIPDNNVYVCADQEYQTQLASLSYFKKRFPQSLFGKENINVRERLLLSAIIEKENEYYDGNNVENSYENLEILKGLYWEAYIKLNKSENSQKHAEAALERYNFINNRIGAIDKIFNLTFNYNNVLNSIKQGRGTTAITADYLLLVRSGYAISYFNFSPLVWRSAVKPNYTEEKIVSSNGNSYLDLIKSYPREKVISWNKVLGVIKEEIELAY